MTKEYISLSQKNPQLAFEWHPNKNEELTPNDVTAGFSKNVYCCDP